MKGRTGWIWIALLYLLRFDFWDWHSPELVLGLPIGLVYHVSFCFVVAIVLALYLRRGLVVEDTEDRPEA